MKVTYIKNLMISGISTTTNNANEIEETSQKIAPLWEQYDKENIYNKTFNKAKSDAIYGVYSNYKSDVDGDYDITVGVEVTKPKNAITIKDAKYLLFTKKGEISEIVFELWEEIWDYFANNNEYKRSYKVDFEKYSKENEIEIYISIS